jgi:hypothetical protein
MRSRLSGSCTAAWKIVTYDNGAPTLITPLETTIHRRHSMRRQVLIAVTLVFVGAFLIVAQLAWNTAESTTGPWFSSAVSRDVYSTTMIGSTLLVAALAALASAHSGAASREARNLDLRLAILRGGGLATTSGGIDIDQDIEDTLDQILGAPPSELPPPPPPPVVTVEKEAHDTLISVTTEATVIRPEVVPRQDHALREVARARAALQGAGARIWTAVAGPMAAAIGFLGMAGAMLPGAEGFAETHFVLNTAVILFLAYGWTLLAGWAAFGLAFTRATEPRPATELKRA